MTEEGIEEARTRAKQYAKEKGFVLNVDEKQLSAVLRGLRPERRAVRGCILPLQAPERGP